ncbi:MAG TPA: SIS domain-containing protein [Thermoplasmata archaeon]|nr:SIS domain-containing protein [Thermoplasmata archaeon]
MRNRALEPSGPAKMRALAAALPSGLRDGFRSGVAIAPGASARTTTVFCVGMGGSGIASELARGLVAAETALSLEVVRSPDLPRAVGRHSLVVLVSYSGTTWETLRAYDAAGRAGARRVVVTSGGTLAERAERDGVPFLPLPPGIPPRTAVGTMFGGLLGLIDPLFPESNERRLENAASRVEAAVPEFGRARGLPARLARRLGDRLPIVYAESAFAGLARRWATQIEENAKCLAFFDEVPELFHNALVGWDAVRPTEARRCAVVLIEWSEESAPTRKSFDYLDRLLARRGVRVLRVPLESEDRLEALLVGLALGDHLSLFLAEARHVDPYPVEAITRLKAALADPARR